MKARIITSIVLILVLVPVFMLANNIIFSIVAGIIAGMASFEWLKCVKCLSRLELWVPLVLTSIATPICAYFSLKSAITICVLALIYNMGLQVLSHRRVDLTNVSKAVFGIFYITTGFTSFVLLKTENSTIFWLIFIGAWGCDMFAYFGGKLFGRRKLLPEISPKKTIEGSIVGTMAVGVFFVVFKILFLEINGALDCLLMFLVGILTAIASQMGDLVMSAVKRQYGIKDFSNLLPGHGGILDRFDSILLVAPTLYYVYSVIV